MLERWSRVSVFRVAGPGSFYGCTSSCASEDMTAVFAELANPQIRNGTAFLLPKHRFQSYMGFIFRPLYVIGLRGHGI